MNKEEFKLSDKELHKAIDNLKGTQFLDAFCILDWIIKTRDENKELKEKVNQLETNRDEVRKLLKENISGLDIDTDELHIRVKRVELDKLLERGKE